jgi:tRNA(Ile)-lysidine synthase TilS/MesJ
LKRRDTALLFSGGVDSTYAAVVLARSCRRVHLLTFQNGHGHYGFRRVKRRHKELESRFPGSFEPNLQSIKDLFKQTVVDQLPEDHERYGSAFVWCLGCKLSMHAAAIKHCLRTGLTHIADGSAGDTAEMVEQMPVSVAAIQRLYQDHGIEFSVPVYDVPRDEKRVELKRLGFNLGIPLLDRHLLIQPSCIPGELYYLPFVLFGRDMGHKEEAVERFFRDKLPFLKRWISGEEK